MAQHREVQQRAAKAPTRAAGNEIMKESKVYRKNNTEAQRQSNRRSKLKSAIKKLNFKEAPHPYATLLLEARVEFKALAHRMPLKSGGQYPETKTFAQVLSQPTSSYCVLDSACRPLPWPSNALVPGNSRDGRDLYHFAFYSTREQWVSYYIDHKQHVLHYDAQGNFSHVTGVRWRVIRWRGGPGSWMNPAHTISDVVLPELAAMQLLVQLTEGLDVFEYVFVDRLRINSLLRIYGLGPLPFFDLCEHCTIFTPDVPRNPVKSIFRNHGVVPTPDGSLTSLKDGMWDRGVNHSIIRPDIRDIPTGRPPSDPATDVQRTWNLLILYWKVFRWP